MMLPAHPNIILTAVHGNAPSAAPHGSQAAWRTAFSEAVRAHDGILLWATPGRANAQFRSPIQALMAALALHRQRPIDPPALVIHATPDVPALEADGLMDALLRQARPGVICISQAARALMRPGLPPRCALVPYATLPANGGDAPQAVFQVVAA